MDKITFTATDGTATDYFPQAYTDAAVATALANVTPAHVVTAVDTEVDIIVTNTDGTTSTKKFVPAA